MAHGYRYGKQWQKYRKNIFQSGRKFGNERQIITKMPKCKKYKVIFIPNKQGQRMNPKLYLRDVL